MRDQEIADYQFSRIFTLLRILDWVHGVAVGWGTVLQAGRSRVRFPMVPLEFVIDIILQPHCGPGVDSAPNRNEYQEYCLGGGGGGKGGRCLGGTTL
jgi:hypothetical protein